MISSNIKNKYNYNQFSTIQFDTICNFPIFIFDLSYKLDAIHLTKEIYNFKSQYPVSMNEYNYDGTNVRAWHSDYSTHKMTNILDGLIELQKQKIEQKLRVYGDINTYTCWINIYNSGNYTQRHKHNDFGLSTIYYPYVEENPTPVIFDNNNLDNFKEYKIEPKTNMLVVFHSSLYHRVPKITEKCRISISSNISVERKNDRDPFIFQNIVN